MIHILDLHFQVPQTIATFVVETSAGPVLLETGPHSCIEKLEAGINKLGYQLSDIEHVLLSHIHFDHAGAAWAMAEAGAKIYVHPIGYPHLLDPSRLYHSAKRIYGDMMEKLWGLMKVIPEDQLIMVEDHATITVGDQTFKAWYTPGHAPHHIVWQMGEVVFAGDIAGCSMNNGPVVPPCPPPDINLEAWYASIDLVLGLAPKEIYLAHFGKVMAVEKHFASLKQALKDWGQWIKPHWEAGKTPKEVAPLFQAYVAQQMRDFGLNEEEIGQYETANPSWMSVAGLMRYWKKKAEREA